MAETLTVKLVATGLGNSASDPINSHSCDTNYATIRNGETLARTTGDHAGQNLGKILKVEMFCLAWSPSLQQFTVIGGFNIDTDNFSGDSDNTLQYFDVTSVRSWGWSDFASDADLHIDVDWNDPANDLWCYCIGFRVSYRRKRKKDGLYGFNSIYRPSA